MTKMTAEFDSVEQAETAALRLREQMSTLGKVTIESRRAKKDIDTPFMLPYAPQSGLDPWIMLPADYGFATDSGYLENNRSVSCFVELGNETDPEKVRAILVNNGATSIK